MRELSRLVAVAVGAGLVLATVAALVTLGDVPPGRSRVLRPAGTLVVLSLAWLLVNAPFEGRVLWAPVQDHGLTLADLLVLPALLVAALLVALYLRG